MTRNIAFTRKIIYLCIMALLLIPISMISRPATTKSDGGVIAQIRKEHNFASAQLGDIDPVSDAMNLALFGMRGVAANLAWTSANHYAKVHDYDKLNASVQQIIKLQPRFIAVWRFQAWNIAYNVSVEQDDYRRRYAWVKKGTDFLVKGIEYNSREPRLLTDIAMFFGQKIGRSDERVQFRRLFRDDTDYHKTIPMVDMERARGADDKPDNWLVAWLWSERAQDLVDNKGVRLRGKSPVLFHSDPSMNLMNYAESIEKEGVFGEKAAEAWKRAYQSWIHFGERQVPTSFGRLIRLNDSASLAKRLDDLSKELDQLAPGLREKIKQEKLEKLTPAEQVARAVPESARNDQQRELFYGSEAKIAVTDEEIVNRIEGANKPKAEQIGQRLRDLMVQRQMMTSSLGVVNFEHWRTRAAMEQTAVALKARKSLFEAEKRVRENDIDIEGTKKLYEEAWLAWDEVFKEYPDLLDAAMAEDLFDPIENYQKKVLDQLNLPFPQDFKLWRLLEKKTDWDTKWKPLLKSQPTALPAPAEPVKPSIDKPATEKPATEKPAADKLPAEKPVVDQQPATKTLETKTPATKTKPNSPEQDKVKPSEQPAENKPAK